MSYLAQYQARHARRDATLIPDHDLLLLSIAENTEKMLVLAERNQEYIEMTMKEMKNDNTGTGSN